VKLINNLGGIGMLGLKMHRVAARCGKDIGKLESETAKLLGKDLLKRGFEDARGDAGIDPDDAIEQLLAFNEALKAMEGVSIWLRITWQVCESNCCCLLWNKTEWESYSDEIACTDEMAGPFGYDPSDLADIERGIKSCFNYFAYLFRKEVATGQKSAECLIKEQNDCARGGSFSDGLRTLTSD
jgi:hypothetical protein